MPPKRIIEYTVFVIDCRFTVDKKLNQLYNIFATKAFNRPTKTNSVDQQRIILINSRINNSMEPLNEWSFYEFENLKIIKNTCKVNDLVEEKPVNKNNFLKAINYAIESLNEKEDKKNILIKRIIVLTELLTPINIKDDHIIKTRMNLLESNATLYIIGVDCADIPQLKSLEDIKKLLSLNYLSNVNPINSEQKINLAILRRVSQNNILIVNYQDGFHLLFAYKSQIKDPYPWYVNLSIGTDLKVPVYCYKTVRQPVNIKVRPAPLIEGNMDYNLDKVWIDLNTHEEVPPEDVVKGYRYHGRFISFTPEQENQMKSTKTFNKCLSIVAFIDASQIPVNLYSLPTSMNKIKPDMRSVRANSHGFKLFAASLRQKNVVALAKRVYNNGFKQNIFAIYPCPEHVTNSYLLMSQLPFAHQFKDRFYRGIEFKIENIDPELKKKTYAFLDAMTVGSHQNGKPIFSLSENLKFNMNRARHYEFIARKQLDEDSGESPEIDVDPYLSNHAEKFAESLMDNLDDFDED